MSVRLTCEWSCAANAQRANTSQPDPRPCPQGTYTTTAGVYGMAASLPAAFVEDSVAAFLDIMSAAATESRDAVLKEIVDKEETVKLRRMGMEGEPVTLQLSAENLL